MLLLFIYLHFVSDLSFRFLKKFFKRVYFECGCVCIFIIFLSEAV